MAYTGEPLPIPERAGGLKAALHGVGPRDRGDHPGRGPHPCTILAGSGLSGALCARVVSCDMSDRSTPVTCQALLFDLDGVLVDSTTCIEDTWRVWAAQHRLDVAVVLGVAHGRRAAETVRIVAPHLDAEAESAVLAAQEARATTGVSEARGAAALVSALPPDRWAIVTSGVRAVAEHRLRHVGLPIPAVMVCADEVSRGKPDPEGYLAAAAGIGIAPRDCVVVEDAPLGLQAAEAASMRALAVASTHPPSALHPAVAVINTLDAARVRVRGRGRARRLEIDIKPVDATLYST
jgi:mannitol-1-/sugar-/sorbitol-6-phosphatase